MTLFSALISALAVTSFLKNSRFIDIDISTKSLIICSTSLPTYPTSVNFVASTFKKGAWANLASLLAISVFPTPVGPIIKMFFGRTSSLNPSSICCLLHLFLKATATDLLALFWPTINLSNSETISFGVNEVIFCKQFFPTQYCY